MQDARVIRHRRNKHQMELARADQARLKELREKRAKDLDEWDRLRRERIAEAKAEREAKGPKCVAAYERQLERNRRWIAKKRKEAKLFWRS